jgi:hypothetical protein
MERLAVQDLAPLRGDNAGWPWDIGAVAILDGSGLVDRALTSYTSPRVEHRRIGGHGDGAVCGMRGGSR